MLNNTHIQFNIYLKKKQHFIRSFHRLRYGKTSGYCSDYYYYYYYFSLSSANFFSSYFQYVTTCRFHFWYEISVRLCALKSDTVGPKSFFLTELLPLVLKTLLSLKLRNRKRQLMKCNEENVQNVMTKLYRVLTEKI